jgi:hypothetical protein
MSTRRQLLLLLLLTAATGIVQLGAAADDGAADPTATGADETAAGNDKAAAKDAAEPALDPELTALLAAVRRPYLIESWLIFEGSAQHRGARRGSWPIALRAVIKNDSIQGELRFGTQEVHVFSQEFRAGAEGFSDQARPGAKDEVSLADIGVRPDDLTFSFLYWRLIGGGETEKISGQQCRAALLEHADGERARVWIAAKYGATARVSWFKVGSDTAYRTLTFKGFKKFKSTRGDLWLPVEVLVEGDDWATRLQFTKRQLALWDEEPVPTDLFSP